jgi:hypothetical protein
MVYTPAAIVRENSDLNLALVAMGTFCFEVALSQGVYSLNRALGFAPGSPWQNRYAERLIGSIRREYVDRSSASVPSSHDRLSVGFTTDIAESSFRYTQGYDLHEKARLPSTV